jgi:putative transposase
MPRGQKFKAEEIIAKLREAEVELARGKKIPEVCKQIGVTEQTYYRWKKEYGGLRVDQAKRLKDLEKENARPQTAARRRGVGQGDFEGSRLGKLLSPTKRRRAVEHVRDALGRARVSERRACEVLNQSHSTQRRAKHTPSDEPGLLKRMVELASDYGRYGYRRVTALLRAEGWRMNHKRVARLWRQEGLKVPRKQPKRKRLWLADGSCVRLRPAYQDHVWSYDFVADRTSDGRAIRMLTLIDEHTRECLAIDVARSLKSEGVLGRVDIDDGGF